MFLFCDREKMFIFRSTQMSLIQVLRHRNTYLDFIAKTYSNWPKRVCGDKDY